MPALSDAVVIGTVLTLVFAAVAYYLYSRIIQNESKLSLMESILLNLKMATEATLLSGSREDIPAPIMNNNHPSFSFSDEMPNTTMSQEQHVSSSSSLSSSSSSSNHEEPIHETQDLYKNILESAHQTVESKDVVVNDVPSSSYKIEGTPIHVTKDTDGNSKVHIGFESMSWKELCAEAKKRNITGTSHLNRRKLIDILNKREGITTSDDKQSPQMQDLPSAQEFSPDGVELSSL
jgi:hypothetical protein